MAKKTADVSADLKEDTKEPGKWQPTYQQQVEFDSHLFELKTEKMLKNISWSTENPDVRQVDHQHFFHTHDSGGREQVHSTSTGGHFHVIEVGVDPKTGAPTAKCSGPKTYSHLRGKKIVVDLPAYKTVNERGEPVVDRHTHEALYHRSSRIKPRTVNAEALKIVDRLETSREQTIPGIQG